MNITIYLPPELEAKILQHAAAAGKPPAELAAEALSAAFSTDETSSAGVSLPDWLHQFETWVASHPSRNPALDDSREALNPDRW